MGNSIYSHRGNSVHSFLCPYEIVFSIISKFHCHDFTSLSLMLNFGYLFIKAQLLIFVNR